MVTRTDAAHQWWQRLRRQYSTSSSCSLARGKNSRSRPRLSQLERLERRELMAYDPLMYTYPDSPWNTSETTTVTTEMTPAPWDFTSSSFTTADTAGPDLTYPDDPFSQPAASVTTDSNAPWLSGTTGWGIAEVRLLNDTGSSDTDRVTWDPTLVGRLSPATSTTLSDSDNPDNFDLDTPGIAVLGAPHVALEWDHRGSGEVNARTWIESDGTFVYVPGNLEYGNQTVRFRVLEWTFSDEGPRRGPWHSFSFTHLSAPAPRVEGLEVVVHQNRSDSDASWASSSHGSQISSIMGVTVEGVVRGHDNQPLPFVAVYLDLNGNGIADTRTTTGDDGRFQYLLGDIDPGLTTIRARSSRWDTTAVAKVFGDWITAARQLAPHEPSEVTPKASVGWSDDDYRQRFEDQRRVINGDPAVHRELQRQLDEAEQTYQETLDSAPLESSVSDERLEYRRRLQDAWREYQSTLHQLSSRLRSEEQEALGMLGIRSVEADHIYLEMVTNPEPLSSSGMLGMEEAYAQYSEYLKQVEQQAQSHRAELLAEADREFNIRVADARRIYAEEKADAWSEWRHAQINAERRIAEMEAEWIRESKERQVLAWKSLHRDRATAILAAARAQAEHRLRSLADDDVAEEEQTLAQGEHERRLYLEDEAHRIRTGAIQIDATYALTNVIVRYETALAHLAARFDLQHSNILFHKTLRRNLAAVYYEAEIERAQVEYEYLRFALPLEVAQTQGLDPAREDHLAGLRQRRDAEIAKTEHRETHRRTEKYQVWSQKELDASRDYQLTVNRLEQLRNDQLSEHDARRTVEMAELDAAYFQALVTANGQLAQVQSATAAARHVAEVRANGDMLEAALGTQRAMAEGTAIHQAVVAQAGNEAVWAASIAAAYRDAAREASAAASELAVGQGTAYRQKADTEVLTQTTYLAASRAAHWAHERAVADAKLEYFFRQITTKEHAERLEAAVRTKREREASGFIVRTHALTNADVAYVQQMTLLQNEFTRGITEASQAESVAQTDAESALWQSNTTDWRVAADALDHAAAGFDRQQLAAQLNWIIATTSASRHVEDSLQRSRRTDDHQSRLVQARSDAAFPVIQSYSRNLEESPNLLTYSPLNSSTSHSSQDENENAVEWKRIVAEAEQVWNVSQLENLEELLSDLGGHDDAWLNAVTGAHLAGLEASRSGQIEYLNRLIDAVLSRSAGQRSNEATWSNSRIAAEGQLKLQAVEASGRLTRAMTAADGSYAVAVAGAERQWTLSLAQEVARLHIAGEVPEDDATSPSSITASQQDYREARRQAEQRRANQLRQAAIERAERIGDALIARGAHIGTAGQELAEENGRAGLLFTQVSNSLETSYAIAVSEAERRLVESMVATAGQREIDLARAALTWSIGSGQAEQDYFEHSSAAAQVAAETLAVADVEYYLEKVYFSSDSELPSGSVASLEAITPYYIQHRGQLASADGRLGIGLSSAATQLASGYGANDVEVAIATGAARVEFARAVSGTVRQFQMSVVNADNLLLAQAAYHDQTRARARASVQAEYDVAAAHAAKQFLVGMARLTTESESLTVHRQWELAMADEDVRYIRRQAEIEHDWTTEMLDAEEFHTRFILAAAFSQQRALTQHRQDLLSEIARLSADAQSREARLASDWGDQLALAKGNWRHDIAESHADFQNAQIQITRDGLLSLATGSSVAAGSPNLEIVAALAAWWNDWQEPYREWIHERGTIETRHHQGLGDGFQAYADFLVQSDRQYTVARITDESTRRLAEIDAWDNYSQYMVSPAKQLDLARAEAERDLKIARAEVDREAIISGGSVGGNSSVSTGDLTHHERIEAAERNYQQAELVAASSRDNQLLTIAESHRDAIASQSLAWHQHQHRAYAEWSIEMQRLAFVRADALQQLDGNYLERAGSDWSERFAHFSSETLSSESRTFHDLPSFLLTVHGRDRVPGEPSHASLPHPVASEGTAGGLDLEFPADLRDVPSQTLSAIDGEPAYVFTPAAPNWLIQNSAQYGTMGSEFSLEFLHPRSYHAGVVNFPDDLRKPSLTGEFSIATPWTVGASRLTASSVGTLTGQLESSDVALLPGAGETSDTDLLEFSLEDGTTLSQQADLSEHAWQTVGNGVAAASTSHSASGWSTLFRDLSLMTRHPWATIQGAVGGFATSGKVLVNGTLSTLKSTATLGLATSPVEILSVSEEDRANGYDTSFAIFRASQELLVGSGTGKLAAVKYSGHLGQVARGAYYWDAAQNVTSMTRGAYGVTLGEGWTAENSLNLAGGMLGISGNVIGRTSPTRRAPHHLPAEVLEQPQVGIGVILDGKRDKIGHAFVVFDWPNGARQAYGFYPQGPFMFDDPTLIARLLGRNGGVPAIVRAEGAELLADSWTLLHRFRTTQAKADRAFDLVHRIRDEAHDGLIKYHAASQCATFARRIMREAGMTSSFLLPPYPPLMYATLWFSRTLG
jgi:hypothetical protein